MRLERFDHPHTPSTCRPATIQWPPADAPDQRAPPRCVDLVPSPLLSTSRSHSKLGTPIVRNDTTTLDDSQRGLDDSDSTREGVGTRATVSNAYQARNDDEEGDLYEGCTFAQHTGECAEGLWDSAMNDDANGSAAIRPSIPLANENDENGPPVDVQCLRVASRRISGSLGGHWARASLPVQNSFPTS
ncbi:hypothetical protein BJ912DRAFT_1144296 [Pholiota molesta]|nr:hypothetical protein BJ912DRAFT_1144296 [Pholiota molesta]